MYHLSFSFSWISLLLFLTHHVHFFIFCAGTPMLGPAVLLRSSKKCICIFFCSILVSSLDWSNIRPNLPWLVDAGGCVLLDAFVS